MSNGNDNQAANKNQTKYLCADAWNELAQKNTEYLKSSANGSLNAETAARSRTACCSILDARLEALATENNTNNPEYKECVFLRNALQKGWLVTDISMLSKAFEFVYQLPSGSQRRRGMELMADLASEPADTLSLRYHFLEIVHGYFKDLKEEQKPAKIDDVITMVLAAYDKQPSKAEYPKDPVPENFDEKLLDKQDYVMEKLTAEELEEFKINEGRKLNNITKSNRRAIQEVMGAEVYDDIDEMYTGDPKDRKVLIHHAQGNKWMKSGEDVLELNFLGSARTDEWREHKGKYGWIDTEDKTEEEINTEYGLKAQDADGNDYSYIRYKDKQFEDETGKTYYKRRYVIGGVTPGLFGALNVGENSIENVKYYGRDFAADFLKPHFDKWISGEEAPHDLHISLTGWSRGAVAAGQAIKKIDEWIEAYKKENPLIQEYLQHVKIDALLKDPVPGVITNFHLSTCNLRNIPNLNTTVYCTMASDHYDLLYPFQHVKGAKKIILSAEEHALDFERVDASQKARLKDGKEHQSGFYDAETGEFFRGTGVSQLQNGVFICDDRHNLIRLSSYSQLGKLMKSIFDQGAPQRTRKKNLHKMVRDWFVENTLEMGFADEETRAAEKKKNSCIEDRILASPNTRIAPVQAEIRRLRELMQGKHTKRDILRQNKRLIKVCRQYMKKTAIPASGDSEYRVNLVSDLLSFTMKESNQLNTELIREKNPAYTGTLDAKIRAHRDRLVQKEGALARKQQKETERLKKEKTIDGYVRETAKLCRYYLSDLKEKDKNRLFGVSSDDYNAMTAALERGSRLGPKTSVNDFTEVLREITKATDKYVEVHKGIFHGPFSEDGQFRQNAAKMFSELSKNFGRKTEDLAAYLPDRDMPIADNIQRREAGIHALNQKLAAGQQIDVPNEHHGPQPGDGVQAGPAMELNL